MSDDTTLQKRTLRLGLPWNSDVEPGSKQLDGGTKTPDRVGPTRKTNRPRGTTLVPNTKSLYQTLSKQAFRSGPGHTPFFKRSENTLPSLFQTGEGFSESLKNALQGIAHGPHALF